MRYSAVSLITIAVLAFSPLTGTGLGQSTTALECRRTITIYLDFSATMTGRAQANSNTPLSRVASMLDRLLGTTDRFAKDGDTVRLVAFGRETVVVYVADGLTQEKRQELRGVLTTLASPGWRNTDGVSRIRDLDEFVKTTNFVRVLQDIRERAARASDRQREIFMIASDFVHDETNDCKKVAEHRSSFMNAFKDFEQDEAIKRALRPARGITRAQALLLTLQPVPYCEQDPATARLVLQAWARLRPKTITDFNRVDDDDFARAVEDGFATPVEIASVQRSGRDKLAVTVTNPTCEPVTVSGFMITNSSKQGITIPLDSPVTIAATTKSEPITIQDARLQEERDREISIQAVSSARSLTKSFWNGDTLSVDSFEPRLFPRLIGDGRLLVVARAKVDALKDRRYRFTIDQLRNLAQNGRVEKSVEVNVEQSQGDENTRDYVLTYDVPDSVLAELAREDSLTMTVEPENGGRFMPVEGKGQKQETEMPKTGADGHLAKYAAPGGLLVVIIALFIGALRGDPRHSMAMRFAQAIDLATFFALLIGTVGLFTDFGNLGAVNIRVALVICAYCLGSGVMTFVSTRELLLYFWKSLTRGLNINQKIVRRDRLVWMVCLVTLAVIAIVAFILLNDLPADGLMVGAR